MVSSNRFKSFLEARLLQLPAQLASGSLAAHFKGTCKDVRRELTFVECQEGVVERIPVVGDEGLVCRVDPLLGEGGGSLLEVVTTEGGLGERGEFFSLAKQGGRHFLEAVEVMEALNHHKMLSGEVEELGRDERRRRFCATIVENTLLPTLRLLLPTLRLLLPTLSLLLTTLRLLVLLEPSRLVVGVLLLRFGKGLRTTRAVPEVHSPRKDEGQAQGETVERERQREGERSQSLSVHAHWPPPTRRKVNEF